jgi:molybdenum cofactor synthesis domain-containing protein
MLGPKAALSRILEHVAPVEESERVPLSRCVGRVLAEEVVSDVDLPPFEKSAMDGYAVHSADFAGGAEPTLPILGESRAGVPYAGEVPLGSCVAIYTGAEVPPGCDAVVMVEKTEALETALGPQVLLRDAPGPMQNICNRGEDLADGAAVLPAGRRLRAVDLSALAAVGCEPVPVVRRPRVRVLTSGDELVTPDQTPGVGQIREGNTLHLAALCALAGAEVTGSGIVRDDPEELRRSFAEALESCDALVTTGGVSMGRYDLVGDTLEELGVEPVFHKVAIKPGKPLWFGARGRVPVFALPGNPVSCLVNHVVFVRPALAVLGGETEPPRSVLRGRWAGAETRANPREQHLPVRLVASDDGATQLEPVRWNGSADVVGIAHAEALAVVPAEAVLRPGDAADYRMLR